MSRIYKVWYTDSESEAEVHWCVVGCEKGEITIEQAELLIHCQLYDNDIHVEWVEVVRMQEQQEVQLTLRQQIENCAVGVLCLLHRVFVR